MQIPGDAGTFSLLGRDETPSEIANPIVGNPQLGLARLESFGRQLALGDVAANRLQLDNPPRPVHESVVGPVLPPDAAAWQKNRMLMALDPGTFDNRLDPLEDIVSNRLRDELDESPPKRAIVDFVSGVSRELSRRTRQHLTQRRAAPGLHRRQHPPRLGNPLLRTLGLRRHVSAGACS